jgi:feruloyl-CoA synthase
MRVERALFLTDPPSIDLGEITDKGYINQRAVLARRGEIVAQLYAGEPAIAVVLAPG